jgi:hypothetical protein
MPVSKVGSLLNKMTNIYSGGGLQAKAGIGVKGAKAVEVAGFATDSFMKALGARTTFAVTFGLKDGFNTLAQRTLVNDEKAFQKAATVTAINSAITIALGSTKKDDTAHFYRRMFALGKTRTANPGVLNAAQRLLGDAVFTGVTDLFDNYLTMSLAASSATKGTFEVDWDPSRAIYATLMAKNAFTGAYKSGAFISNRIGQQSIRTVEARIQEKMTTGTPAERADARALDIEVKNLINKRLADPKLDPKDLATGKVYWDILLELSEKLDDGTLPIKDQFVKNIVSEAQKETDNEYYQAMMKEGELLYDSLIDAEQGFMQRLFLYGFRNTDGTGRGVFWKTTIDGTEYTSKEFIQGVYASLKSNTEQSLKMMGDIGSLDDVARMVYDLVGERDGFNQEDYIEATKFLDMRYENNAFIFYLKGLGTDVQSDPGWSRTQAILRFAEKYGVLVRFEDSEGKTSETEFVLAAMRGKDMMNDPDATVEELLRRSELITELGINNNVEKPGTLKEASMKTMLDSVMGIRNTISSLVNISLKETITADDIKQLKLDMNRPELDTAELLATLHADGIIKGPSLIDLYGKLSKAEQRKINATYIGQARKAFEIINEAQAKKESNPDKSNELMRQFNSFLAKNQDPNFLRMLGELYGIDFSKEYQKQLSEVFSSEATRADIISEIKKSFEQTSKEFIDDTTIRFEFTKEDGSVKTLLEVATELKLYDENTALYKELSSIANKSGNFKQEDLIKVYQTILKNADDLPTSVVLSAAKETFSSIFKDEVVQAKAPRIQVNLNTLETRLDFIIKQEQFRNPNVNTEGILETVRSREGFDSTAQLLKELDSQQKALEMLRITNKGQSVIVIEDVESQLGPLGYDDYIGSSIFDKYFGDGIVAIGEGDALVEIKKANFSPATITQEEVSIPGKSNKESQVLNIYGVNRKIDQTSTIVDGVIDQFIGIISKDISIAGETIKEAQTKAKGFTSGSAGKATINKVVNILGKEFENNTPAIKYVFVKNLIEEMTRGEYSKGLETYIKADGEVTEKQLSKQEIKSEFIKRFPEGKELLSDKLLDQVINLIDQEQKGVIPSGSSFRALSSTPEFEGYVFEQFLKENNIPLKTTETISEGGRAEKYVNAVKQLADFLTGPITKPTGDISRLNAEQVFGSILDEVIRTQTDPSIQDKSLTGILNRVTQSQVFIVQIQAEWDRTNLDAIVDSVNAGKKQPTSSDFKTMIDAAREEGKEFLLGAELTGVIPDVDSTLALDFYNYYKDNRRAFLNTFRNNKTNVDILNDYKKDVTPATTRTVERDVTQNDFRSDQEWTNYRNNFNDEVRNFIRQNKSLAEKSVSVTTTGDASRYEKYWDVERMEDGRLKLTNFKGVDNIDQLDPSEIKYIIPLELREQPLLDERDKGFLYQNFKYGSEDEDYPVGSGGSNLTVHKLISSYYTHKDVTGQKQIMESLFTVDPSTRTYGLIDETIPIRGVAKDENGNLQRPTIDERNIYKLARMESSIVNDADRMIVEIAKHFIEMSGRQVNDAERLATDPLFRTVLNEDQTNDPEIIAEKYLEKIEQARQNQTVQVNDSDYERVAGTFVNLIVEHEFNDLVGNIREILGKLEDPTTRTKTIVSQSIEDNFLETNVIEQDGKFFLPVKSLIYAPEKIFDKIDGNKTAKEKYNLSQNLIGKKRSEAARSDMLFRDFPSQIRNRSNMSYISGEDENDFFDRVMENSIRNATLRGLENTEFLDIKYKNPLERDFIVSNLIDKNNFRNETIEKITLNSNQRKVLLDVYDRFNGSDHPSFVVVLKDGTVFNANDMEYGSQGNYKDNSLMFEFFTRKQNNPNVFDDAVIFTADGFRKSYFTSPKISGASFDTKIIEALTDSARESFAEHLSKNNKSPDLLNYNKVIADPELQKEFNKENSAWLARQASRKVRDRAYFNLESGIKDLKLSDKMFDLIEEAVFGRDPKVDNLVTQVFGDGKPKNDRVAKSIQGLLTDGVALDDVEISKANEIADIILFEARTTDWISDKNGVVIVSPEIFDIAYDIIDRKVNTLLSEINSETIATRKVPTASKLSIPGLTKIITESEEFKMFIVAEDITKKQGTQQVRNFIDNRLQDLITLSVFKNSLGDATNVLNSNAVRVGSREGYNFGQSKKEYEDGVKLKQTEDFFIERIKDSKKLYTDSEYYEVNGVRKYVSISFLEEDGTEHNFYFKTVAGDTKEDQLRNLTKELIAARLPKDVREGIIEDYTKGIGKAYSSIEDKVLKNTMQGIVNRYSRTNKGVIIAHAGRDAEFKDYITFLGLNLNDKDFELVDSARFASQYRLVGPDSTPSNALDSLRAEYVRQGKFQQTDFGKQHTAIGDAKLTKKVVDQIVKDFEGYKSNRLEGGRLYNDYNEVLNLFETNKGISFDRNSSYKETDFLLNATKGVDNEVVQDKGSIASAKTFVEVANLIRQYDIQKNAYAQDRRYKKDLSAYNLSPINEEIKNQLNILNSAERIQLGKLFNILSDPEQKLGDLSKKLRYDYEVKENKNLSPSQILERLLDVPYAVDKLGITKEQMDAASGEKTINFLDPKQLAQIQKEMQEANNLLDDVDRAFDFIFKDINVKDKKDFKNILLEPFAELFSKDYDIADSYNEKDSLEKEPFGIIRKPTSSKRFIDQIKTIVAGDSLKVLNNPDLFSRDLGKDKTNRGPYTNLAAHAPSYKTKGDSEYKTFKANEGFISPKMLDIMLDSIPVNQRPNYIFNDNIGKYIWTRLYVNPNDNEGKFIAIKLYVGPELTSENVEMDPTLLKMLARDTDGDKIGFVPVHKKEETKIAGYEFANRVQFEALNEFKQEVKILKDAVSVGRSEAAIKNNEVLQFVRGLENGVDFDNKESIRNFFVGIDQKRIDDLFDANQRLKTFDPKRDAATDLSILFKIERDVQRAGVERKLSIARHKEDFASKLPSIAEQLEDPQLLAKSVKLPIMLDDEIVDLFTYIESLPKDQVPKEVTRIKNKYNLTEANEKTLFNLPAIFNKKMLDFAKDSNNNAEYIELLKRSVELRNQNYSQEISRLEEMFSKYIGPNKNAFISRGGDYEDRVNVLDKLYDNMERVVNKENLVDPEAPLAIKGNKVRMFVSTEIPSDSRFTNKNYKFDEQFAGIKNTEVLTSDERILFDYVPKTEIPIVRGQALYETIRDGKNITVRSDTDGYARVYVDKDNKPNGIIIYESNPIGAETKISAFNSAIGKTTGINFIDSDDDNIAHYISLNTFKLKKVADFKTIRGIKIIDDSDVNLVTKTINGKEYRGSIIEMDMIALEDVRLWKDSDNRLIDRTGIINNLNSVFGRLEFNNDDVMQFIDLMDKVNYMPGYHGADATNSVWELSVFAPLKLLDEKQKQDFFLDLAEINITEDKHLQMYNAGPMLRDQIETILGKSLSSVTREEVISLLKKDIKDFNPEKFDNRVLVDLIWKSINGDLIALENNYETFYDTLSDPGNIFSKRVGEAPNAEIYKAEMFSPVKERAGTIISEDGSQLKIPMYRPILTTDIARAINEYIDEDKFLFLMENNIHKGQDAYIDNSTSYKPISKNSIVFDRSSNAIAEEFYKTSNTPTAPSELRLKTKSPMNYAQFERLQSKTPVNFNREPFGYEPIRSTRFENETSRGTDFVNEIKYLLEGVSSALKENPDNLGMVSRLKTSRIMSNSENDPYYQDKMFENQNGFRDVYSPGYGMVEGEDGKISLSAVINTLEVNNNPANKNFGRTTKGNQNQTRQEFFAQKILQNKNYFDDEQMAESIRLAENFGKPVIVEIPKDFFKNFESNKVYDLARQNIEELKSDLNSIGLEIKDYDPITKEFMSNKQRSVSGSNLYLNIKRDISTGAGLSQKGEGYQIERSIKRFEIDSRIAGKSLSRNAEAISSLLKTKKQKQDFVKYHVLKYFDIAKDAEIDPVLKEMFLRTHGPDKTIEQIQKEFIFDYETINGEIVKEYNNMMKNLYIIGKEAFLNGYFTEPIDDPIQLLYPSFIDSDDPTAEKLKGMIINKTVTVLNTKEFNPSTLDFDPLKSAVQWADRIGKKIAIERLAGRSKELGLTDNVKTVNLAREFVEKEILNNSNHVKDVAKAIKFLETDLIPKLGSSYERYSELVKENLKDLKLTDKTIVESRLDAIETLIDEKLAATQDVITNSVFAKSASSIDKNYETLDKLESEMRNNEFSQIVNPLKEALLLRDQFYGTLASVKTNNKFIDFAKNRLPGVRITDEYMRSLESDFFVKPYDNMSLEYIKTSLTNMNRPLLLRALEGRVYATNKDYADHLNKYFFRSEVSGKASQILRKYSNLAVKLIMGNPLKLMERIEYFTATDLYMLTNVNPFATTKMGRSRKELIGYQFAKPSEGEEQYAAARSFLTFIGNEAGSARRADFYTRTDEISPSKLDNPVTNKTLDFIEIQNNFTRYALYLQTLEDLEKHGRIKYYGNAYVNKEGIDQFKTNEEKAWAVVSSNIPLFGDLPFALRYTTPWLVFASFPLAQARHLGEWVKSYHKIIKDDVVRNDPKDFLRNAVMPAGMLGLEMLLAQLLISAVADMYNVDDETAEQWKKDDSFISIFQTMFFDKPTIRQGSANPYRIVYNNLIGTGVEAATDRRTGELRDDWLSNIPIGYFNKEIAGRLNPTLKVPLEVIFERDFFGTDYRSAPYDLNYMQNMLRKVGGYVIGTQSARALTDALVLNRYQPEERNLIYSMIQGISNGVADEFGNSKTYKRDIKDFYAARSIVYGHLYGTQGEVAANNIKDFNAIINNEVQFSTNSDYNPEQVDEISELLRAAMFREEDVSVLYNILLEKIDEGYAPSTLTAALNRVSVSRIIERIKDPDVFWESLSQKERAQLENGLAYERRIFPALNEINFYSNAGRTSNNFVRNIYLPYNQHRYMPYQNNYYANRPQQSRVNLYQNMGTFNPRYAANSAYERWVKRR